MKNIKVTYLVILALVVLMIVTLSNMGVHNLKELDTETFETLKKANVKETYNGVVIGE